MDDLRDLLTKLELEKYLPVFVENEIAVRDLVYLTDDDLRQLGLGLGPRRRLAAAVRCLVDPPSPAAPSSSSDQLEAERRQLSVLFADLVGSTELAAALDPEDMRSLLRLYQNTVAGEVTRLDGHVAKYLGDGVLAYFGWPGAHEDDAERAVRVGLAVTRAVSALRSPSGRGLAARVGVAPDWSLSAGRPPT